LIASIAEAVAGKLAMSDWSWHTVLRPMGYDLASSKCILEVTAAGKSYRFLVKISNSFRLNELIDKEAGSMLALARLGVNGIPELILHGSIGGRRFLVQRFIDGEKPHASREWLEPVFNLTRGWLAELYSKAGFSEISADELIKRSESNVKTTEEFFETRDSLSIMEGHTPQSQIPATWIHGDFWHGNMIKDHAGRVWLTDFSMSSSNEPPLDVFDLVLDYEPKLLTSTRKLGHYVSPFLPADMDLVFLTLYNLNRKIALKVTSRKMLYEEMLMLDMHKGMAAIEEAEVLRYLLQHDAFRSG
jgi:hypothetical protein